MEPSSTSIPTSAFLLAAARAYGAALRVRNGARAGQRNGPAPAAAPPPAVAARRQPSRICAKTVMDESDPDIVFDADGVSNWWHDYQVEKAKRPDEERHDFRHQAVADEQGPHVLVGFSDDPRRCTVIRALKARQLIGI